MIPLLGEASTCSDTAHCAGLLTFNATIFVEMGIFLVTALLLWYLVWKPVVAVIEDRERAVAGGGKASAQADELVNNAARDVEAILNDSREKARAIVSDAAREASQRGDVTRAAARERAQATTQKAHTDVAAERDAALAGLAASTRGLVAAAGERLLGSPVDPAALARVASGGDT